MTTEAEVDFPPLRRDHRVHGWILSTAISQAGDVAWYIGLAWSAAQVTTPAGAGLVMGIGALPKALVLLYGGALADRFDGRRTMILANLGRIVVLVVAAVVLLAWGLSLALVLTVAVVFGAVDALYTPAAGTLPRRMVRSDDLVKLSAGGQLAHRLAVFVGAPLALIVQAAGCVLIGLMPRLGMFVAMAMIGATAGIASAQLSAAFQQSVDAGGDTLNLYDVSALAHADLIRAGAQYDNFDAVPHAFGLAATAHLYRKETGDRRYDDFGAQQLDWTFGANPWGVSFMVGVGQNAERCLHHQIANLLGRERTGAVVNGPNSADLFADGLGGHLDGMSPCPADGIDRYAEFTGHGSRYVDDVRSWQASEPADDFAAIAVYALTR